MLKLQVGPLVEFVIHGLKEINLQASWTFGQEASRMGLKQVRVMEPEMAK